MKKAVTAILLTAFAFGATATVAKEKVNYEYDGKVYETKDACLKAKKKAKKKGAIVGAVGGAATTAVFGGNLGESALASGVGAVAGGVIGNSTKKC